LEHKVEEGIARGLSEAPRTAREDRGQCRIAPILLSWTPSIRTIVRTGGWE
jgi:hypothetical protein